MSDMNSRTRLKPAVIAKETPADSAMFPTPFQLPGSQIVEMEAAPRTPVTLETEKASLPSGCRAVNVLIKAC